MILNTRKKKLHLSDDEIEHTKMSEPEGTLPINEENISGADDSNGTGQFFQELLLVLIFIPLFC